MTDEEYMQLALAQARKAESYGEVPIGAIVVHQGEVLARACNMRESTNDPAGHAELLALQEASRMLKAWRLTGCTVYVTLEPCVMCAGLMHQARIDRCVFGAYDPKAGALETLYSVGSDDRLNHTFEVTSGICADECAQLLSDFFARKRKRKTNE